MPYTINGTTHQIEEPKVYHGRHYVPLADIVRSLGGNVEWNNETKTATATVDRWKAEIADGAENIDVSGTPVKLSAPAMVEGDRLYVPYDFFRDAYGYKVELAGDTLNIRL